jgi:hypothetical protein
MMKWMKCTEIEMLREERKEERESLQKVAPFFFIFSTNRY